MITQAFDLNLIPGGVKPVVKASQYDASSRTLSISLFAGVSAFPVPSGAQVLIQGTKQDGTGFQYGCTAAGNVVSAEVTQQMTVFAGPVEVELQILSGGEVLGTGNFILQVEQAALADDTIISETDIPIIQRIPEYVSEAEGYAHDAQQSAEEAAAVSKNLWYPTVNADGDISWQKSTSETVPTTRNIKGPQGTTGPTGPTGPTGATGNGIASVEKTGSTGMVDYYRITFTDGTHFDYTVTNGSNVEETNSEPYILRQGKGDLVDMEIVGASVAWNQLVDVGSTASNNSVTWTSNGDGSYTVTGTASAPYAAVAVGTGSKRLANHIYLIIGGSSHVSVYTNVSGNTYQYTATGVQYDNGNGVIFKCLTSSGTDTYLASRVESGTDANGEKVYPQLIDLTASLGTTIADYIYSLEQNNAGDGVAWFRQYFPNVYYGYDPGSIQSVNVSGRKVVGKNLLDTSGFANGLLNSNTGEDEYTARWITSDYVYVGIGGSVAIQGWKRGTEDNFCVRFCEYDVSKNFIKNTANINISSTDHYSRIITLDARTRYVRASFGFNNKNTSVSDFFGTNDIQLELGSTATAYEPYTSTTYPLDSSKELRGLFQLVNGKLKADGDVYKADRQITRSYNLIVPDKTQNWQLQGDGTDSRRFALSITGLYPVSFNQNGTFISSMLTPVDIGASSNSHAFGVFYISNHWIVIPDKDSHFADMTAFKAWLESTGFAIVYQLATPTTESAEPYQNPQRAYTDGTEEFIDYAVVTGTRDVAIPVGNNSDYTINEVIEPIADYVDGVVSLRVPISMLGTDESGRTTASQSYASGDYFYKDGYMCKVLTSISAGATLTLNTNYSQGTLADILKAIENA